MTKLQQELDGLRLTLEVVRCEALLESDVSHYAARIRDSSGTVILELRLPASMVESSVARSLRHEFTMSPDGLVSALYDGSITMPAPSAALPVDTLVEQSLTPVMLEDEPGAMEALNTLRDRLKRALLAVDAAQARLK